MPVSAVQQGGGWTVTPDWRADEVRPGSGAE